MGEVFFCAGICIYVCISSTSHKCDFLTGIKHTQPYVSTSHLLPCSNVTHSAGHLVSVLSPISDVTQLNHWTGNSSHWMSNPSTIYTLYTAQCFFHINSTPACLKISKGGGHDEQSPGPGNCIKLEYHHIQNHLLTTCLPSVSYGFDFQTVLAL